MKMLRSINIISLLSLLSTTPLMAASLMVTDLSKPVNLGNSHHSFTIQLPRNATTGYMWVLDSSFPTNLISPVKQTYVESNKKLIGGGGHDYWAFAVKPSGYAVPLVITLKFEYVRPWERGVAKTQTIEVIT